MEITGIYREPKRAHRRETWDLFHRLKNESQLAWCLIGDMNNLASNKEKRGGRRYPEWLLSGFLEALRDCKLQDLELQGQQFIWKMRRGTNGWVEERLDKALVSSDWIRLFPSTKLLNLEISTSNHSHILLNHVLQINDGIETQFRFKNA